jgi:quercetin dioxygenase-like cupin family protein
MKITKAGSRPTKPAPAEYFTGTVLQDEVVVGTPPSRLRALSVSFTPGARTAWHTHPVGQTLYVLYGTGRIQKLGEPPVMLCPGDTVVIPPDVKHWHGAAPDFHSPGDFREYRYRGRHRLVGESDGRRV